MFHLKLLTVFIFCSLLFTAQAQKKKERYTILPANTSLYLAMPDGEFEGMIYASGGAYEKEKGDISGEIEFSLDSVNIHRIKDTSKIMGLRKMLLNHPFFDTSMSKTIKCAIKTLDGTTFVFITINNVTKKYRSTFGIVDLSDRQAATVSPFNVDFNDFYDSRDANNRSLRLSIHVTAFKVSE